MGSEDLGKLLSKGKLYMIMEICRAFDQIFKEHLDDDQVAKRCTLYSIINSLLL
ncbi:hypothetical protein Hanom_Chr05g00446841 [Helianthus anomalus]